MVWDGYILGGNFLLDGTSGKHIISILRLLSIKILQSPFVNDGSWNILFFGNFEEIWLGMTCLHEIEK